MRVIVWNVRGVGKPSFYSTFHKLGQLYHPELYILLETRLCGSSLEHIHRRLPVNWDFYAIEFQGMSGSITVVWEHGAARVDVFHRYSQLVAIVVTEFNRLTWLLSGMYASIDYREQRILWQEVMALIKQGIPMVVAGDFNCVFGPKDKRGGRHL